MNIDLFCERVISNYSTTILEFSDDFFTMWNSLLENKEMQDAFCYDKEFNNVASWSEGVAYREKVAVFAYFTVGLIFDALTGEKLLIGIYSWENRAYLCIVREKEYR